MLKRFIKRAAVTVVVGTVGVVGLGQAAGAHESSTYVVKPGDTLSRIAPSNWRAVAVANGIDDPDLIFPGQVIRLDVAASTDVPAYSETGVRDGGRSVGGPPAAPAPDPAPVTEAGSGCGTAWPSASRAATGRRARATDSTAACSSRRAPGRPPVARATRRTHRARSRSGSPRTCGPAGLGRLARLLQPAGPALERAQPGHADGGSTDPPSRVRPRLEGRLVRMSRYWIRQVRSFAFCCSNSASEMTPWSLRAASLVSSSAGPPVPAADRT